MVSLALIPSLPRPGFPGNKFPEKTVVLISPRITVRWWGSKLIQKLQAKYKICSTRPFWPMSTTLGFQWLMAEAVCGSSASMGLHFPQEQLTRITPIFARLLSPLHGFRAGVAMLSPRKESGQDNSHGQASEYFECTRKHYEHGWDVIMLEIKWWSLWW